MRAINTSLKLFPLLAVWLISNTIFCYAQTVNAPVKSTTPTCGCPVIDYVVPGPRYFPGFDYRITYPELKKATTWQLFGEEKSFRLLFTMNDQFSGSGVDFREQVTLISPRDPIKIVHPDKTFTVNLTPCPNQTRNYSLPITATGQQKVIEDVRDFDYTKFQNTTLGYVHLFLQISGRRPDEMIRIAYKSLAHNYGLDSANRAISKMNREFETGIPPVAEKNYQDSLIVEGILDSLVAKKLRQELVLTDAFILMKPGLHPPTYDEQYRMEIFFQSYCPYYAFQLFDINKLRPKYEVDFNNALATVEISSKIIALSKPNPKENLAYNEIWIDFKEAKFTSEAALEITVDHACLQPSVIAGTNIGIDFNKASLITDPSQNFRVFDFAKFPQLVKNNGNKSQQTGAMAVQYDTLLTRFSGLAIANAGLTMSVGTAVFVLNAKDLIINNRVIAGCITADIAPKMAGKVLLKQTNGMVKPVSLIEFLTALKKAGLNDLVTKPDGKQMDVYFKKTDSH